MHIRCKQCHGSVQFLLDDAADPPVRTSCPICGQTYLLKLSGNSTALKERLFTRARRLAQEHGIDLPGAYSMLVGVMDLEQVRAMHGPSRGADPGPPATAGRRPDERYDPAFDDAVEAGFLTPMQALARGKRDALAAKLVDKHHLSPDRAFEVADNRVSLLSAIRDRTAGASGTVQLKLPARPPRARTSAILTVALVGVLAVLLLSVFTAEHGGESSRYSADDVRLLTNDDGRIVRIEGPDPASVLDAYCKSDEQQRQFEPLGVRAPAGDGGDLAMGILRDRSAPKDQLAIYISLNRSGRGWTAGNGRSPLVAFQAPLDSR